MITEIQMLSLLCILMGNKGRCMFFSSVSAVLYRFGHVPDSLVTCMLSSQFSPQNLSDVTLQTVPGSRQCGAIPGDKIQHIRTHRNKVDNIIHD